MKQHGSIIECYGCGSASCSMCAVFEAKSEQEAIKIFIKVYGIEEYIIRCLLPHLRERRAKWYYGSRPELEIIEKKLL